MQMRSRSVARESKSDDRPDLYAGKIAANHGRCGQNWSADKEHVW